MNIPVAILVRVSTAKQETARQESELRAVAEANKWTVLQVIRQTVSGRASEEERDDLAQIRELVAAGKVRKVLVHEISRLARRNSVAHRFVEDLTDAGVSLYWHAQRIETLLPSGKINPAAALMLALLSEMARNEAETTRERIMSGLAEARRKGKVLGRPEGWRMDTAKFLAAHAAVVRQLKAGKSIRDVAKLTGCSTTTVQKVKRVISAGK